MNMNRLPDWLPSFLLALLTAYSAALLLFPLLRRPNRLGFAVQWLAVGISIGSLFWIPPDFITIRGLAALFCTDLLARLIDFGRQTRQRQTVLCGYEGFLAYIVPFPISMVVYGDKFHRLRERPPPAPEFVRIGVCGLMCAAGWPILFACRQSEFLRSNFIADHCVKVVVWLSTLEFGSQAIWGVERLLGFADGPPMAYPSLARTPADFWLRWNRRAQRWFYLNAFVPAGGKSFPVRGVVATFVVSGFIHELLFDIATSDFNGWQGLFFLIQLPVVLVSRPMEHWVRRRGAAGRVAAHAATIAWFWMTSVLFFHGIEQVFPFFYAGESPLP